MAIDGFEIVSEEEVLGILASMDTGKPKGLGPYVIPKSLVIFNMKWDTYDISGIREAARSLDTLARYLGVGNRVQYDFLSSGAGECCVESKNGAEAVEPRILQDLHEELGEVWKKLQVDPGYMAHRERIKMFQKLQHQDCTLAAVFNGRTEECNRQLKHMRVAEHFEDRVYGCDRTASGRFDVSLYVQAIQDSVRPPERVVAVEETPQGASCSSKVISHVVGYVPLRGHQGADRHSTRCHDMAEAGVKHLVSVVHDIPQLISNFKGRADMRAKLGLN